MNEEKIDFVITWVDGNDINWINERKKYCPNKEIDESRYRDWELLRFWFRAIEKYANWVNKIFFVTSGHIPSWLNTNCKKIQVVKHNEFIDEKYLPTFNSCVIEMNMHKIKGLSNKFIYFNDDTFINEFVNQDFFFKEGLPCNSIIIKKIWKRKLNSTFINYNCNEIIGKNFDLDSFIEKNRMFIQKNGNEFLKNLILKKYPSRYCLCSAHMPNSYNKETFNEVWNENKELLLKICENKFRTDNDVSQWLFEYWQIVSGKIAMRDLNEVKYFSIESKSIQEELEKIEKQSYKLLCINDSEDTKNFEECKKILYNFFEKKFPEKSNFEK